MERGDYVMLNITAEDREPCDLGMSGLVLPGLYRDIADGEKLLMLGHLREDPARVIVETCRTYKKTHLIFKEDLQLFNED